MKALNLNVNTETLQNLERGPRSNLFSGKDHEIVRKALAQLEGPEHQVIVMRFWEKNTLDEISEILEISVQEVEKYLVQAMAKLKMICLGNPAFSRALAAQVA